MVFGFWQEISNQLRLFEARVLTSAHRKVYSTIAVTVAGTKHKT